MALVYGWVRLSGQFYAYQVRKLPSLLIRFYLKITVDCIPIATKSIYKSVFFPKTSLHYNSIGAKAIGQSISVVSNFNFNSSLMGYLCHLLILNLCDIVSHKKNKWFPVSKMLNLMHFTINLIFCLCSFYVCCFLIPLLLWPSYISSLEPSKDFHFIFYVSGPDDTP